MKKNKSKKGAFKGKPKGKKAPVKKGATKTKAKESKATLEKIVAIIIKLNEKVVLADVRSAKPAIEAGRLLSDLREQVKEKKRKGKGLSWTKFVGKNFPHITMRTIQRYIKLANNLTLEDAAILYVLGQTVLLDLIKESKGAQVSVTEFIEANEIKIPADKEGVHEFRKEVAIFLNTRHREKKKAASGGSGNGDGGKGGNGDGDGDAGNQDKDPDADDPNDEQGGDPPDPDDEESGDDDLEVIGKEPPSKPKTMLQELNEEGRQFAKKADHVIKNKRKIKKVSRKSLQELNELVADLTKQVKALKELRAFLEDDED